MLSEEKLSQAEQKNQQIIGKIFLLKHTLQF